MSIMVAAVPDGIPAYDRDEWRHWIDEDRDCQDTRQEALIEESTSPVEYKDSDQCKVASGEWTGPYTGERFTDPSDLDIDHMVPLANAHRSGGWLWSASRRRDYANDLSYKGHLIAAQSAANRAKGAKGPEEWRPPDPDYWCQYATDWIAIKNNWKLTATEAEASSLSEMLGACSPPIALTTVESAEPQPQAPALTRAAQPIAPPASDRVYDSCDEAEAAGEERVQGSQGNGRGFLASMVPSASDRDGDGVVCEK